MGRPGSSLGLVCQAQHKEEPGALVTDRIAGHKAVSAYDVNYLFPLYFDDDPYALIRFRGEPLPSMLSMDDDSGTVVHASSFTKTVCPGVRVGYLVGHRDVIAAIAKRATNLYISPGMVSEAVVHQFCVAGDIERFGAVDVGHGIARRPCH